MLLFFQGITRLYARLVHNQFVVEVWYEYLYILLSIFSKETSMIKRIAIIAATAFAFSALTANACPLQDAAKKAAAGQSVTTTQPATPAKPAV
jgi:hypothetical protein